MYRANGIGNPEASYQQCRSRSEPVEPGSRQIPCFRSVLFPSIYLEPLQLIVSLVLVAGGLIMIAARVAYFFISLERKS